MSVSLDEKLAGLSPDRLARIKDRAEALEAEYVTLRALREARSLTQTQLAERLGKKQATIAEMEKRSDLLISTLRETIEAMGGQLELSVAFPGGAPLRLKGLGDDS